LTRVDAVRSNRPVSRKTAIVLFGGLTTAGSALGILIACLAEGGDWLGFAVPGVGIVLLLGVALLGHYSETVSAESAMRHGLAAAFVGVYFTVLGFSVSGAAEFSSSLVKNLTWVVGIVVTFYFGATTAIQLKQPSPPPGDGSAPLPPPGS
jgi:hypothetical protein